MSWPTVWLGVAGLAALLGNGSSAHGSWKGPRGPPNQSRRVVSSLADGLRRRAHAVGAAIVALAATRDTACGPRRSRGGRPVSWSLASRGR